MTEAAAGIDAARLMDRIYARQRHIYDASRKFFLLGRDGLIAGLDVPLGGTVLELACGTGRNLIKIARRYPTARCYGLDLSTAMLSTARAAVARTGLEDRIILGDADAATFDPLTLFAVGAFDRIVISYALSMIPPWREVLRRGAACLAPGGTLHVIDFGDQKGLPRLFKTGLEAWLAHFHVTPRLDLAQAAADAAHEHGMTVDARRLRGGYATSIVLRQSDNVDRAQHWVPRMRQVDAKIS